VEVTLLNANGNSTGRTAITDATGFYFFDELRPGTYGVAETDPDGFLDGLDTAGTLGGAAHNPGDLIDAVKVVSGDDGLNYNFGEILAAGISGHVYEDVNNNGHRDAGEPGISGVELTLLDAAGNPTTHTTVTDATGYYSFEDLMPGTYGVAEAQPQPYRDGLDSQGTAGGTAINPGDKIVGAVLNPGTFGKNYDFGEVRPASISGYVYLRLDEDCTRDPTNRSCRA